MKRFTSIDLFCGCGGFSLGLERAGFTTLAAIDSNPEATQVFRKNLESCHSERSEESKLVTSRQSEMLLPLPRDQHDNLGTHLSTCALEKGLTRFPPRESAKLISASQVDVIAGGPPCRTGPECPDSDAIKIGSPGTRRR